MLSSEDLELVRYALRQMAEEYFDIDEAARVPAIMAQLEAARPLTLTTGRWERVNRKGEPPYWKLPSVDGHSVDLFIAQGPEVGPDGFLVRKWAMLTDEDAHNSVSAEDMDAAAAIIRAEGAQHG